MSSVCVYVCGVCVCLVSWVTNVVSYVHTNQSSDLFDGSIMSSVCVYVCGVCVCHKYLCCVWQYNNILAKEMLS